MALQDLNMMPLSRLDRPLSLETAHMGNPGLYNIGVSTLSTHNFLSPSTERCERRASLALVDELAGARRGPRCQQLATSTRAGLGLARVATQLATSDRACRPDTSARSPSTRGTRSRPDTSTS